MEAFADNDEEIWKIRNERRKHMNDLPPVPLAESAPASDDDMGLFGDDDAALIGELNQLAVELSSTPTPTIDVEDDDGDGDDDDDDDDDDDSTPLFPPSKQQISLPTEHIINIENVQTLNVYVTQG